MFTCSPVPPALSPPQLRWASWWATWTLIANLLGPAVCGSTLRAASIGSGALRPTRLGTKNWRILALLMEQVVEFTVAPLNGAPSLVPPPTATEANCLCGMLTVSLCFFSICTSTCYICCSCLFYVCLSMYSYFRPYFIFFAISNTRFLFLWPIFISFYFVLYIICRWQPAVVFWLHYVWLLDVSSRQTVRRRYYGVQHGCRQELRRKILNEHTLCGIKSSHTQHQMLKPFLYLARDARGIWTSSDKWGVYLAPVVA